MSTTETGAEDLAAKERERIEEVSKLSPRMIFEVIRRDGEEELRRPFSSLFWSGIAAGIMISLSVLGEAVLRSGLPDAPWRHLVENFGYSLGFLVVILGRMQLFTENTITTVIPAMADPRRAMLLRLVRLWAVVLLANVIGALAVGGVLARTPVIPEALLPVLTELSHHATGLGAVDGFFRAIPAGVLVAAIVWMLPESEGNQALIVILFTWLIAAGDFAHVVAGSVEAAILIWQGLLGPLEALGAFFLPVLAGNIVGGTAIFALITYGQVHDELPD
ncbi:Formate/nitrite transporter FocA, FNT family [Meinhardsimonia xiamenensis]|jgi:formate/nitrite transporter FocA (FNT family)|uniref:Formate/nitrite transporter FocA, FNT family n=1 Tax=Meinhardsimonia xiamenensis TaxID=990712 RepID=A0A1G9EGU7_9RHOB|nr:formate/nitrite transporter family protein [Meinhardsimonia xiamenensis]PRX33774.1 formate/nitrite transporter FocA (FNT family) [Meinhardsimonia xiamenensis]SDK75346.1 Formate/nitrite transporter FocA, FNT family [Meinhardsimonia xiamenensis]